VTGAEGDQGGVEGLRSTRPSIGRRGIKKNGWGQPGKLSEWLGGDCSYTVGSDGLRCYWEGKKKGVSLSLYSKSGVAVKKMKKVQFFSFDQPKFKRGSLNYFS